MKRIYYDVETTGLSAKDEVIEFAAVVTDDNNNILELKDFYCYTTQPITKGAQLIHGIDKHTLNVRSKGKFFEEQFIPWANSLGEDVVWFDWSNGGFDRRLINQTLTANGYDCWNFGNSVKPGQGAGYCNAMSLVGSIIGRRALKLEDALAIFRLDNALVAEAFKTSCSQFGISDYRNAYHTALFDAFVEFLLVSLLC